MGICCGTLCWKERTDLNYELENIVDLREDFLHYPIQCLDTDSQVEPADHYSTLSNDFIDLREDVFPVQCTEPS